VAYSDGVLDPYEDALVRQIAGLIHVPDRERGLARRRALEKLKAAGATSGKSK
ncbi:MAG: TerB family tellurite resistance protein, partial [Hyphomicrobium sp.]